MSDLSFLDMSDDEFMSKGEDFFAQTLEADPSAESGSDSGTDEAAEEQEFETPVEEITEEEEFSEEESTEEESGETDDEEHQEEEVLDSESEDGSLEGAESDSEDENSEDDESQEDDAEIDYKAVYEQIFKPFKANGREVSIESPEDVIQLMQMGANYNKKMAALKPNLRIMKMLDKNGVLAEDKLSFAIDLLKGDKQAIAKLIADNEIDPYDLNAEQDSDYSPKTYTVDDREIELDEVLDEIRTTPTFNDTIDLLSNKWDEQSRQIAVQNPQVIRTINEHMQNGIYAQIQPILERERMLGKLDGLSDLQAYRQIGDRLFAAGKLNATSKSNDPAPKAKKPAPKPKPQNKQRKRAVAPPRKQSSNSIPSDFNPLALSDEEFEKQFSDRLL